MQHSPRPICQSYLQSHCNIINRYLWGSGQGSSSTDAEYDPDRPWAAFGLGIVTSAVLYGYLIPISLYISLELVRLVQSTWLISGDAQMYCDEMERASEARTSNLAEDLGRVEVILSDKTGTLTRNQMDFYQVSDVYAKYVCFLGPPLYPFSIMSARLLHRYRLRESCTAQECRMPRVAMTLKG